MLCLHILTAILVQKTEICENKKLLKMKENKRRQNFAPSEIDLLVTLVAKYKDIIECKKSDVAALGKKEAAWRKVEEDFNSQSESSLFRDENSLRKKYNNLKTDLKKKAAAEKESVYATGCGPPSTKLTDKEDMLLSILHEKQINGMQSQYVSDFIPHTKPSAKSSDDPEEEEIEWLEDEMVSSSEPVNENGDEAVEVKENTQERWNKYSPGMLRQPKSAKLKASSRGRRNTNAQSSWSKLAEVKAKWTEEKLRVEIDLLKEEHQKRVSLMEEKAKLERELMREKHEIELQVLKKSLE